MKELYIVSYEPDGDGTPYFFDICWVPDRAGYELVTSCLEQFFDKPE